MGVINSGFLEKSKQLIQTCLGNDKGEQTSGKVKEMIENLAM